MKKDIHPKLNPVVFIDLTSGTEYKTMSTITSDKTKKIDGVDHQILQIQVSSSSHPFYTGKHRIVDTENLVKKFEKKAQQAEKFSEKIKASKEKQALRKAKSQSIAETKRLTLKDMLKQMQ